MRKLLSAFVLLAIASVYAGPLQHFEVRARTEAGANVRDIVQADSPTDARLIAETRYAGGKVNGLVRIRPDKNDQWFVARLSVDGVNLTDMALARGSGAARRVFIARFPDGRIVSLSRLKNMEKYSYYKATIRGVARQAFDDTVLMDSASNARKTFIARFPEAKIASVTKRPQQPAEVK